MKKLIKIKKRPIVTGKNVKQARSIFGAVLLLSKTWLMEMIWLRAGAVHVLTVQV